MRIFGKRIKRKSNVNADDTLTDNVTTPVKSEKEEPFEAEFQDENKLHGSTIEAKELSAWKAQEAEGIKRKKEDYKVEHNSPLMQKLTSALKAYGGPFPFRKNINFNDPDYNTGLQPVVQRQVANAMEGQSVSYHGEPALVSAIDKTDPGGDWVTLKLATGEVEMISAEDFNSAISSQRSPSSAIPASARNSDTNLASVGKDSPPSAPGAFGNRTVIKRHVFAQEGSDVSLEAKKPDPTIAPGIMNKNLSLQEAGDETSATVEVTFNNVEQATQFYDGIGRGEAQMQPVDEQVAAPGEQPVEGQPAVEPAQIPPIIPPGAGQPSVAPASRSDTLQKLGSASKSY